MDDFLHSATPWLRVFRAKYFPFLLEQPTVRLRWVIQNLEAPPARRRSGFGAPVAAATYETFSLALFPIAHGETFSLSQRFLQRLPSLAQYWTSQFEFPVILAGVVHRPVEDLPALKITQLKPGEPAPPDAFLVDLSQIGTPQ